MTTNKVCRSTPGIRTGEIQHEVLNKFRNIESNDVTYLNKTEKAIEELRAFQYTTTDSMQAQIGSNEQIEKTFKKERSAGLEYQNDTLFEISTTSDYNDLSVAPQTNTVTKLLELRPLDREDFFAKMYIRFVTESILYNVALGYAEDVLKLEYGNITAYLSIKDLIILFLYCEGQVHQFNKKISNSGTTIRNVNIPKFVQLSVPYKKKFNELTHDFDNPASYYHWRNNEQYLPHVLTIVPDELTLKSNTYRKYNSQTTKYEYDRILPEEADGVYRLSNPDEDRSNWKWVSDNGSTIAYDTQDSGVGRWVFSFASGQGDTASEVITYSSVQIPYWNWLCWHPNLVYLNEQGDDISVDDAHITVTKFHYRIDDMMPNYETTSYLDYDYPDESLVHLIDKQASNFVDIYKEYMFSGLSRQHSAFLEILDDRTFRGVIPLNLSQYDTFKEHIDNSAELKDVLSGMDYLNETTRQEEYTYLADTIIKLLYPIETSYLVDSTLQLGGKLSRIKDLVVELCSYNVAWVTDPDAFENSIIDCQGSNTIDIVKSVYGMEDISRITETKSYMSFCSGFIDKMCYDEIYTKKYVYDSETVPHIKLIDEPVCHACSDHQYIITSTIQESMQTIIADIDTGENGAAIGHVFKTIINLADSDQPRSLVIPESTYELMTIMRRFVEELGIQNSNTTQTTASGEKVTVLGKEQMLINLCNCYNAKFRDSTFASLLEYDSSYAYHRPSWGTGVTTNRHLINK